MNRFRSALTPLVLVLVAGLLLTACGKKRPPVVSTTAGGTERGAATSRGEIPAEPLDMGPDVQPVPGEGVGGELLNPEGEEGGPLADIHFGFDQATLTDEGRAILEKHALWLQSRRDLRVTVEGHCDERGTAEYNLALGDQRAQVAREYLLSLGVGAERLTAVSYGKERPLDPGHDEAAWARNRRAHFAVSR